MRYVDRRKGVLWPMSSCQGIKGLSEECKPIESINSKTTNWENL